MYTAIPLTTITHQVQSHLDPDSPAPVDDLEGYQTLVQNEPHPCAVNLQMLKRIDRITWMATSGRLFHLLMTLYVKKNLRISVLQ